MKVSKRDPGKVILSDEELMTMIKAQKILWQIGEVVKDTGGKTEPSDFAPEEDTGRLTKIPHRQITPKTAIATLGKVIGEYTFSEKELEDGSCVMVINNGASYTTYKQWVDTNIIDEEERLKYDFGFMPANGSIGRIITKAPHTDSADRMLYCINVNGRYYVIGEEGITRLSKVFMSK